MPECATQTEARDTYRNVYTQCGNSKGIVESVIVEYFAMKEGNTRPRILTNKKKAREMKEGMNVSDANTEKVKKETHRKCVGTDGWIPNIEEEKGII